MMRVDQDPALTGITVGPNLSLFSMRQGTGPGSVLTGGNHMVEVVLNERASAHARTAGM
jgi:hypothetical protein